MLEISFETILLNAYGVILYIIKITFCLTCLNSGTDGNLKSQLPDNRKYSSTMTESHIDLKSYCLYFITLVG